MLLLIARFACTYVYKFVLHFFSVSVRGWIIFLECMISKQNEVFRIKLNILFDDDFDIYFIETLNSGWLSIFQKRISE